MRLGLPGSRREPGPPYLGAKHTLVSAGEGPGPTSNSRQCPKDNVCLLLVRAAALPERRLLAFRSLNVEGSGVLEGIEKPSEILGLG